VARFEFGDFSDAQINSIADSTARINLWEGAVRSGKTISSILRWLEYVRTAPQNGELLMLGKTERTLERNILNPIADIVGPRGWKYTRGTGQASLYGRRILISGANDAKAEGKIRGLTLAGAYGDEVTLWPAEVFRQVMIRLSVRGASAFFTTNPDSPYHWLKKEYVDRADELEIAVFHFTLDDNLTLDPAYVAALKREYTGLWFKRFILGLWVAAEGAIFDMFDAERHVVNTLPDPKLWTTAVVGTDYGTGNATAAELNIVSGGLVTAAREYYYDSRKSGRQKTDAEYVADLTDWASDLYPQSWEIDPSAASFRLAMRKAGVARVHDADNSVVDGIRVMAAALANDRLKIHESCTNLIEQIYGYAWDPKAQERGEDRPIKRDDHAVDAERYAVMRLLGRRTSRAA